MDNRTFTTTHSKMTALTTTIRPPELSHMQFSTWSTPYYETMHENVTMDMDDLLFDSNTTVHPSASMENFFYCPFMKSPISNIILMVLYALVCFVGLIGNSLVIYVVFRFSKMQTVTNLYLINLGEWACKKLSFILFNVYCVKKLIMEMVIEPRKKTI